MIRILLLLLFKLSMQTVSFARSEVRREYVEYYTNLWAIQLSKNNCSVLQKLKMYEGFEVIQQKHQIPDLYLIMHIRHPRKGKYENKNLTNLLLNYKGILWADQIFQERFPLEPTALNYNGLVNDPSFPSQWTLQDNRKTRSHTLRNLNVIPVWNHYKLFGKNIKVVVIDAGIQIDHPDLENNYDSEYGYDFVDDNPFPTPRYQYGHATKVAGVIAMQANNNICGVGIAPLVTLGALTIYRVNERAMVGERIAQAFWFHAHDVDISNNSWGENVYAKYLHPMNPLVMGALKNGIIEGRQTKGTIFIFSSGNNKERGNTCAHKSYANSIYTITVGGIKQNGDTVYYSERCSNILVAAYSSGSNSLIDTKFPSNSLLTNNIFSTGLDGSCEKNFLGTSAAVPMVSGIVALILEARYDLSWREVQHALVWTSQVAALAHNNVWFRNKAGFYLSPDFGFGVVDAFQAVTFAKTMQQISPMNSCVLSIRRKGQAIFHRKKAIQIKVSIDGCKNLPSEVNYIEHVQLLVSVQHAKRGAIQILVISPSGTQSLLMDNRRLDKSSFGLNNWIVDTVHFWGERPQGIWSIIFYDTISPSDYLGCVNRAVLLIHGTKYKPLHYSSPRTYYKFP